MRLREHASSGWPTGSGRPSGRSRRRAGGAGPPLSRRPRPASDRDLARWAGITLGDARAGLKAIAGLLGNPGPDGLLALAGGSGASGASPNPEAGTPHPPPPRLLGAFEPLLMAGRRGRGARRRARVPDRQRRDLSQLRPRRGPRGGGLALRRIARRPDRTGAMGAAARRGRGLAASRWRRSQKRSCRAPLQGVCNLAPHSGAGPSGPRRRTSVEDSPSRIALGC